MLTLALRLALIGGLWYPVMLIAVFELWYAIQCSLHS